MHILMSPFTERQMYNFNEEAFQNHKKLHHFYIEQFHYAAWRNCQMIILCTQTLSLILFLPPVSNLLWTPVIHSSANILSLSCNRTEHGWGIGTTSQVQCFHSCIWQGVQRSQGKTRCAEWIWVRASTPENHHTTQHFSTEPVQQHPSWWGTWTEAVWDKKRAGTQGLCLTSQSCDLRRHWFSRLLEGDSHGEVGRWAAGSPPPGLFACIPSFPLPCSAQFVNQIAACLLLNTGRQMKVNYRMESLSISNLLRILRTEQSPVWDVGYVKGFPD